MHKQSKNWSGVQYPLKDRERHSFFAVFVSVCLFVCLFLIETTARSVDSTRNCGDLFSLSGGRGVFSFFLFCLFVCFVRFCFCHLTMSKCNLHRTPNCCFKLFLHILFLVLYIIGCSKKIAPPPHDAHPMPMCLLKKLNFQLTVLMG